MGVEEKETQFAKEAERLEAKVQGMRREVVPGMSDSELSWTPPSLGRIWSHEYSTEFLC